MREKFANHPFSKPKLRRILKYDHNPTIYMPHAGQRRSLLLFCNYGKQRQFLTLLTIIYYLLASASHYCAMFCK